MILHPRFSRLVRYADRNDVAAGRSRTGVHVSSCPRCRATVRWVRDAGAVLRSTDGPAAPAGAWGRIQARLEAGDEVLLPAADARGWDARGRTARARRIAIAASLVLAAGVAAAAVPGPLRQWLEHSIDKIAAIATTERTGSGPGDVAGPDATQRTKLIVSAADGGVAVDIDGADPGLEVRIRTADVRELEVEASGAAAAARFHSATGRLSITDAGAGVLVVLLPRALDRATIGVDGTPYVIKRGDELRVLAPVADTTGAEIVLRPVSVPSEAEGSR